MTQATDPAPPRPGPLRLLVWGGAALMAGLGLIAGHPVVALGAAGAMALAALLPLYTWVSGIVMPRGLATGILVYCLCAFSLGEAAGFYAAIPVWDMALHFVASAVLALVGVALALLPTAGAAPRTAGWILGLLGVGFAALVGACWELFEFSIDAVFGTNAQRSGLPDTMGDVAVNIICPWWCSCRTRRRRCRNRPSCCRSAPKGSSERCCRPSRPSRWPRRR